MPFEQRVAQAEGCQLRYLDSGSGSRPVVMLHGAGGLRQDERVFNTLVEQGYRVIAPSMPGFDESTVGSTASVVDVADVMAAFIGEAAGGPAAVIGESFGGNVASWIAIRHPEVVDRLILAAPAGLAPENGPQLGQLSPQEISVILFGRPPSQPPTPEQVERAGRNRANYGRLAQARPPFDQEFLEHLADIKAPTLVLWGTGDRLIFPSQARYFQERIPRVRLITIEGGPHVLSAAAPDEFLPPVLAFLERGADFLVEQPQGVA
jgi:pimeloyl-ACP methyl ester carboxylesterase